MEPDPGSYFNFILFLETPFWDILVNFPWVRLVLFFFLLALSFFVSGAEIAFLTLNQVELERLKSEDTPASNRITAMVDSRKGRNRLLATILIANNFVNVAAILVASSLLLDMSKSMNINEQILAVINVVLITGILLLLGEIIPKGYARENRIRFAKLISRPVKQLRWLLHYPSLILADGTDFISRRLERITTENASAEDLKHAIDLTVTGLEGEEENAFLKGIVNFSNTQVKSIMRARVDVMAMEIETPLDELISEIDTYKFSRLPVYEENLDQVKGILHIKALLPFLNGKDKDFDLKSLVREAYFVPETKKIGDLLEELKTKRLHMAVVVDEFGGTSGIVTLEDIIEEILGDIIDESDNVDILFRKIDENEYIFEGRALLNDVRRIVNLDEEVFEDARGDSESLGGLILEINGKIPVAGDIITYEHYDMHVEAASKSRIIRVKMVIREEENENGN